MIKKESAAGAKNIKFEEALKRLEKIVDRLETGDVPLEESLALYEEGIALFRHCSAKLDEAKKKVEILSKKGPEGKFLTEPFDTKKFTADDGKPSEGDEIPF